MMDDFKEISLTGRLCYLFMCIEKYLIFCYPNKDWTPIAKKCWQWTNGWWNEGCGEYSKIVPEFLFEYDDYTKTNEWEYDGMLSEEDYHILVGLYAGITDGKAEDDINQILMLPIKFNNVCECSDFCHADEPTLEIILEAQEILSKHHIALPCFGQIKTFAVAQKNGWGEFVDSEYLSEIIETVND